jgi:hypothetical protein
LQAVANIEHKRLKLDAAHPECIPMRRMGTRTKILYISSTHNGNHLFCNIFSRKGAEAQRKTFFVLLSVSAPLREISC